MPQSHNTDSPRGLAFALAAYFMWGFLPLYMKAVAHIPAPEVVAHRILWSVPIAGAVLMALGRTQDLIQALRSPRTLAMASLTAALITINWGTYVWAVAQGRALDAALGYYINPLFSVLLGALLLGERLTRTQMVAVALAAAAVLVLWIEAASLPWPALVLMVSWGFYAYFKKSLPVGPNQGFLLEVLILSGPALAYVAYLAQTGQGHFTASLGTSALLIGCGFVTAIPLMVYANGAKLLRLSTIAILQYIAPTMIFLTAVFIFDEPFGQARMIAFPMIWAALLIYSVPMIRQMRASQTRT